MPFSQARSVFTSMSFPHSIALVAWASRRFWGIAVCVAIVLGMDCPVSFATGSSSRALLNQLNQQATMAYSQKDFKKAEEFYSQAAKVAEKISPAANVAALVNLGAAQREQKNYPAAESSFNLALSALNKGNISGPVKTMAFKQFAHLLKKMNRADEANRFEELALVSVSGQNTTIEERNPHPVPKYQMDLKPSKEEAFQETEIQKSLGSGKKELTKEDLNSLIQTHPDKYQLYLVLAKMQYKEGDSNGVERTLRRAIDKFPNNPDPYLKLCSQLRQTKRTAEAIEIGRRGTNIEPKDPNIYLSLASSYEQNGQISEAIQVMEDFVNLFPTNSNIAEVNERLTYFKKENSKIQSREGSSANSGSQQAPWTVANMPLKVFVQNRGQDQNFSRSNNAGALLAESNASGIIDRALSDWSQASGGKVKFSSATNSESAFIIFRWTDNPGSDLHAASNAGETSFEYRNGHRVAIINISLMDSGGKPYTAEEFFDICLHELGHALGLGHSSKIDDIMYPIEGSTIRGAISQNDRERLHLMYQRF